jgi:hypothetical protein
LLEAGLHLAELHLLEEFLSRFLFRALALAALVPASYSCAQIASSSALLAKDGSAGANSAGSNNAGSDNTSSTNISPNPVALNNQESRVEPDLPPQPKGKTTLLGGKIRIVDHVRDRIVLDVFGGGHMTVLFDERTHVFRADQHGSLDDLKDGERAYVDTTLDGKDIFARNIRVLPAVPTGQGKGQIVDYDATRRELTLHDTLSPRPVKMRLMAGATIVRGDEAATPADLQPGTLVTLSFVPGGDKQSDRQPMVSQVSILASPGATFFFSGQVTFLDLHRGMVVIVDPRDNKSYEVYVDANDHELARKIQEGADVMVEARFNGTHYEARNVTVNSGGNK